MHFSNIRLENFRAKDALDLNLGRRLTLLMGANGSGKTSVLDGLAIGLGAVLTYLPEVSGRTFSKTGDIRQVNNKKAPYARVTLETTSGLIWDRTLRRDQNKATGRLVPSGHGLQQLKSFIDRTVIDTMLDGDDFLLPLFVYYGVSRALLDLPQSRKGFPKKHDRFEGLVGALNADSRFKSAFVWFYNKENEEHRLQKEKRSFDVTLKDLDVVRSAITRMFPDLSDPHIEVNPLRFMITQQGEKLNIAQLSDGYKTMLGLVIDLSSRMAMANPHLDDPLCAEAVVIIDEIDLHLHPAWQKRIVGDLLATFSNTQFIITTHSPYIVESINNYLKRQQVSHLNMSTEDIRQLYPLSGEDVAAYAMTTEAVHSLIDPEIGLLDDQLIQYFNELSLIYDQMRDLEWEQANGD